MSEQTRDRGMMPGLIERLKEDTSYDGAVILMLSASDRRVFRERCQELHQKQVAGLRVIQRPARDQDGKHRAEQRLENASGEEGNLAGEDQFAVRR